MTGIHDLLVILQKHEQNKMGYQIKGSLIRDRIYSNIQLLCWSLRHGQMANDPQS